MPWVFRKTEIKTIGVGTYVLVHMWRIRADAIRGDPPNIIEDFIMNLKSVRQRVVTREDGYTLRESGVWASPRAPHDPNDLTVKENVNIDVVAEMDKNIKLFIDRVVANDLPDMDTTSKSLSPTTDDPRGILARSDVKAAKNKNIEYNPTLVKVP